MSVRAPRPYNNLLSIIIIFSNSWHNSDSSAGYLIVVCNAYARDNARQQRVVYYLAVLERYSALLCTQKREKPANNTPTIGKRDADGYRNVNACTSCQPLRSPDVYQCVIITAWSCVPEQHPSERASRRFPRQSR
jgi:hypothetical protein